MNKGNWTHHLDLFQIQVVEDSGSVRYIDLKKDACSLYANYTFKKFISTHWRVIDCKWEDNHETTYNFNNERICLYRPINTMCFMPGDKIYRKDWYWSKPLQTVISSITFTYTIYHIFNLSKNIDNIVNEYAKEELPPSFSDTVPYNGDETEYCSAFSKHTALSRLNDKEICCYCGLLRFPVPKFKTIKNIMANELYSIKFNIKQIAANDNLNYSLDTLSINNQHIIVHKRDVDVPGNVTGSLISPWKNISNKYAKSGTFIQEELEKISIIWKPTSILTPGKYSIIMNEHLLPLFGWDVQNFKHHLGPSGIIDLVLL